MIKDDTLADADARVCRLGEAEAAPDGAATGTDEAEPSIVDTWEQVKFQDPDESAETFRKLLAHLSTTEGAGEAGNEAIGSVADAFAEAGRVEEALAAGEYLGRIFRTHVSSSARDRIGDMLVRIADRFLDRELWEPAVRVSASA